MRMDILIVLILAVCAFLTQSLTLAFTAMAIAICIAIREIIHRV